MRGLKIEKLEKVDCCFSLCITLNACQSHLPIVNENNITEEVTKACMANIEQMELADIDYLLYANRMVDNMIQNEQVKKKIVIRD